MLWHLVDTARMRIQGNSSCFTKSDRQARVLVNTISPTFRITCTQSEHVSCDWQAHVLRHLVDTARMRAGRMPLQWAPILTFPSSFNLPEPGLPVSISHHIFHSSAKKNDILDRF